MNTSTSEAVKQVQEEAERNETVLKKKIDGLENEVRCLNTQIEHLTSVVTRSEMTIKNLEKEKKILKNALLICERDARRKK